MRICHTSPIKLLEIDKRKQHNTLNINDLGGGYYATGNPFSILTYNLLRCHTKVSDGCAVSLSDATIRLLSKELLSRLTHPRNR